MEPSLENIPHHCNFPRCRAITEPRGESDCYPYPDWIKVVVGDLDSINSPLEYAVCPDHAKIILGLFP